MKIYIAFEREKGPVWSILDMLVRITKLYFTNFRMYYCWAVRMSSCTFVIKVQLPHCMTLWLFRLSICAHVRLIWLCYCLDCPSVTMSDWSPHCIRWSLGCKGTGGTPSGPGKTTIIVAPCKPPTTRHGKCHIHHRHAFVNFWGLCKLMNLNICYFFCKFAFLLWFCWKT